MQEWVQSFVPSLNGIKFVPLVLPVLAVECALEFRILRSTEREGNVADADNQIKALIDALKMPQNSDEIGKPEDYEGCNPLFTLAQDDRLITKISSISDEMLDLPVGWDEFDPKLCRIQIDVFIRPRLPTRENIIFFDDDSRVWDHRYDIGLLQSLAGMSADQLRAAVTQCIFRIQALAASLENTPYRDRSVESCEEETKRMMAESSTKATIWRTNLWPKAYALREELCRRIYGEPPYPQSSDDSVAIMHGMLAGVYPIASAANDLQRLLMRFI
ncbi:hypothetical protein [Sphingobium sp. C100]|uniref:hypothetical protein n=1 Tax=Sphingobium sp. C100 TaxID=1207055 RepID=UPI001267FEE4|nr:hypothetical protein [Sphingobium sp. C100]